MVSEKQREEVIQRVIAVMQDATFNDVPPDTALAAAKAICDTFSLPELLAAIGAAQAWLHWREQWAEFMARNPRSADNSNYWAPNVADAEEHMKAAVEACKEAARQKRERLRLAA